MDAYGRHRSAARRRNLVAAVVLAVLILLAAHQAEIEPATFFANIGNFGTYLYELVPTLRAASLGPDIAAWYWNFGKWLSLLLDTILMAYLGTLFGAVAAVACCFFASENLMPNRACGFLSAASWRSAAPSRTSSSR